MPGGALGFWCGVRLADLRPAISELVTRGRAVRRRLWTVFLSLGALGASSRLLLPWPVRRSFRNGPAGKCRANVVGTWPAHSLTTFAAGSLAGLLAVARMCWRAAAETGPLG